jgi:hypothetical protein
MRPSPIDRLGFDRSESGQLPRAGSHGISPRGSVAKPAYAAAPEPIRADRVGKPAHDVRTEHGHRRQVQGGLRRHGNPISPPQCGEALQKPLRLSRRGRGGLVLVPTPHPAAGADVNGWVFFRPAGAYGTDYVQRALITRYGLGANIEQDAVYPSTKVDSTGQGPEWGQQIRHPLPQRPDAAGAWLLPLNRYTLSGRNKLRADPDGTVELLIQATNPGPDKEANWLPAPNGPFVLMMRLYWPKETPPSLLDGTWKPPTVEKA